MQEPDGATRTKAVTGTPLGSEALYVGQLQLDLAPGGRVLMFTDGVVELPLPRGREFGVRRLQRAFEATHPETLSAARASIIAAIREAQAGVPADDDLTYVLVERAKGTPPPRGDGPDHGCV